MKRSPEPDDNTASKPDAHGPIDPVLPPNERSEVALFMLPASAVRGGPVVDVHDAGRLHFEKLDGLANEPAGQIPAASGWFQPGTDWHPVTSAAPAGQAPHVHQPPRHHGAGGMTLNEAIAAALRESTEAAPAAVPPAETSPLQAAAAGSSPLEPIADAAPVAAEATPLMTDAAEAALGEPGSELEAFPAENLPRQVAEELAVSELETFPSESKLAAAGPAAAIATTAPSIPEPEPVPLPVPPLVAPDVQLPVAATATVAPPADVAEHELENVADAAQAPHIYEEAVAQAVAALPATPSRLSPWFAPPESERPLDWEVEADPFTNSWDPPAAAALTSHGAASEASLGHDLAAGRASDPTLAIVHGDEGRSPGATAPWAAPAGHDSRASWLTSRASLGLAATLLLVSGLVAFGLFGTSPPSVDTASTASEDSAAAPRPEPTPSPAAEPRRPEQPAARPAAPPMPSAGSTATSATAPPSPSVPDPSRGRSIGVQPPVTPKAGAADRGGALRADDRPRPDVPSPALSARSLPPPPPGSAPNSLPTENGRVPDTTTARSQAALTGRGSAPSEPAATGGVRDTPASPPAARETDAVSAVANASRAAEPAAPAANRPEPSTAGDTVVPPAEAPRAEARSSPVVIPDPEPIRMPPPPADPRPADARPAANAPRTAATAAGEATAGDGIAIALKQLQAAYERRDARLAKAIWPTVDERALARAFGGLKSQSVTFDNCRLNVSGPAGEVQCRGVTTYVPLVGSQDPRRESRQWTFRVEKGDEGWLITSAAAR